jgi:hypothetical protein
MVEDRREVEVTQEEPWEVLSTERGWYSPHLCVSKRRLHSKM